MLAVGQLRGNILVRDLPDDEVLDQGSTDRLPGDKIVGGKILGRFVELYLNMEYNQVA